jgi:apolipoprotein N-acyltransferase
LIVRLAAGVTRERLIAGLAGALLPASFAPFGVWYLAPLLLALLFRLWDAEPREAAWRGFWFGVGGFTAGTYWLYHSVRTIGGTPLPVVFLVIGGLVLIMAAYVAACGWLAARLRPQRAVWRWAALSVPALWVSIEWLRGWVLTGFPWLTIGYGQIDGPLAAWAPVAGVHGVSAVTALVAGALAAFVMGSTRDRVMAIALAVLLGAVTALLSGRAWTQPKGDELQVSLVQGAIAQSLKWQPGQREATLDLYTRLTLGLRDQDLVIWPEAAVPVPDTMVRNYLAEMGGLAQARGMQLLIGILTHDEETDEYRNSLLAVAEPPGVYHKRHLVPFGEFFPVPGFIRQWMRMANLPYQDIDRGEAWQSPLRAGGVPLAPTICYEDAYGAEQLGFMPEAQMLVNVSNDAWFGDSIAPHQHLQMARMRSLETGRYLLRSTNTGVTAIIDERGDVTQQLPQFEPAVLTGAAQPFTGATPYVRTGNWPVLLFCAVAIVAALTTGGRDEAAR